MLSHKALSSISFFLKLIYWKYRETEGDQIIHLLIHSQKCSSLQPGLGQAEVRSPACNPGLTRGWQEFKYLSHPQEACRQEVRIRSGAWSQTQTPQYGM